MENHDCRLAAIRARCRQTVWLSVSLFLQLGSCCALARLLRLQAEVSPRWRLFGQPRQACAMPPFKLRGFAFFCLIFMSDPVSARLVCLLNPYAHGGRTARLQSAIAQALANLRADIPLLVPQSVGEAQTMVRALPQGSRLLLAGGDGSVQPLLAELLAGEHELALLPLGTGNDLARVLGTHGQPWQQVLPALLQQAATRMDVGQLRLEGGGLHYFASSLACGLDAAAVAGVAATPAALPGLLRYALAALRELASLRSYGLQYRVDDGAAERGEFLLASCMNTPTYASGMRLAPSARIDDGRLELVLAQSQGLLPTLALFARLLAGGRHTHAAAVRIVAGQKLQLRSTAGALPVLLDGEYLPPQTELDIAVLPQALAVVRLES